MRPNRYAESFKKEVAQEVLVEGESLSQTARRYGISLGSVRAWVKKYDDASDTKPSKEIEIELTGSNPIEFDGDIRELKNRLAQVTQERDTLKSALSILARDIVSKGT